MRKAFTLIEVLIAVLLISISLVSLSAAFKQFSAYRRKFDKYSLLYHTVLSLVDMSDAVNLNDLKRDGSLNGFKYKFKVTLIDKKRNYVFNDIGTPEGNFEIYLYKVTLYVDNKTFSYFTTKFKKISDNGDI